ncbi:hypothetical protein ACFE04_007220 [Oxalis oulophora]
MTISNLLLSPLPPFTPSTKALTFNSPSSSLSVSPLFFTNHHRNRFSQFTVNSNGKNNNNETIDGPDRLIAALCYFYPFFDGVQYGKYVVTMFTPLQTILQPLIPAIRVFKSFPFNGFLVFLTLYFVVVRNQNFSRYVRFNTMQAIVLDVLLIFPDLIERSFSPSDGIGLDLLMSLDSTVFMFLLVSLIYGSTSCALGQLPRLPIVAEAAERQTVVYSLELKLNGVARIELELISLLTPDIMIHSFDKSRDSSNTIPELLPLFPIHLALLCTSECDDSGLIRDVIAISQLEEAINCFCDIGRLNLAARYYKLYTLYMLVQLHESVETGLRYSRYLQLCYATFGQKKRLLPGRVIIDAGILDYSLLESHCTLKQRKRVFKKRKMMMIVVMIDEAMEAKN